MVFEGSAKKMGITPMRFIMGYLVPVTFAMFFVGITVSLIVPLAIGIDLIMFPLLPIGFMFLGMGMVFLLPMINSSSKKSDMENFVHFFVTRIGTLSTAGIPPAQLFKIMSLKKEYKTLAESCHAVYMRFAVWHIPLGNSFKYEAQETPSQIWADFLDRFASALEAGTQTEDFLRVEQHNVMFDYVGRYKAALYNVDVVKEMFISIVIGLVFLMAFAIIIPYLTCMEPEMLVSGSVGFFIVVEFVLVYYLKSIIPKDELIFEKRMDKENMEIAIYMGMAFIAALLLPLVVLVIAKFTPLQIIAAIAITPFIFPANIMGKIENDIRRMDLFYPEFIVSFGHTIHARGGAIKSSLKTLTFHDFGPLTQPVRDLYERLKMRADNEKPWQMFYIQSGSRLIANFQEVFVETLMSGGKPKETCEMINDNFLKMMEVRKLRYNTAGSFKGILYGLHGGIIFTSYAAAQVVGKLGEIFNTFSFDMSNGSSAGSVTSIICVPQASSMQFSSVGMVMMLLFNSLIFAVALKVSDGGHLVSGLKDFVIMVWIGALVSIITAGAIGGLVGAF